MQKRYGKNGKGGNGGSGGEGKGKEGVKVAEMVNLQGTYFENMRC